MKLKTRLIIAFITVITIPVLLSVTILCVMGRYQMSAIDKAYEISGTTVESFSNSMTVISQVTEKPYKELSEMVRKSPQKMEDATSLEEFNKKLRGKKSYLLVRKEDTIIYVGTEMEEADHVILQLPEYGESESTSKNGVYLGGEVQALVKQVDFLYRDGDEGSAYIVSDVGNMIPEVEEFLVSMVFCVILVLVFTAALLIFWIYRGVMQPLGKMQLAAKNIKEGNLDFELNPTSDDELGQLCRDLEDMRKRLKDNVEEKIKYDKENKELISNISHDLKTPVTTIKGYAEGIMDGVADTPEKMERYIRTIYNKATEMNTLINELTLYTKIDTNRIPYNLSLIHISEPTRP